MQPGSEDGRDRYIVKSVVHASAILESFHSPGEVLGLRGGRVPIATDKRNMFSSLHNG